MIGMHVRFDRESEPQAKLMDDSDVALRIFNHGIDDQSLFGIAIACNVAPTFRPVVDVLDIVHIQQNGDGIGALGKGRVLARPGLGGCNMKGRVLARPGLRGCKIDVACHEVYQGKLAAKQRSAAILACPVP